MTTPAYIRRWAPTKAFIKAGCDSPWRSREKKVNMPSNLLGPLISSKTRLNLLLRFFLNQNLIGYLHGLSKDLDENTNRVRLELNRLKEAGLPSAEEQGRRKVCSVNTAHPLTTDLSNMLRKVTGIDQLVDPVVSRMEIR